MTSVKIPQNGSGRKAHASVEMASVEHQTPEILEHQVHSHIRRPDTPERVKAMTADTKKRLRRLQEERKAVECELDRMREDDLRLTMRRSLRRRLRSLRRQIRETLSALAVLVNHAAVRPARHDPSTCCLCIAERGES